MKRTWVSLLSIAAILFAVQASPALSQGVKSTAGSPTSQRSGANSNGQIDAILSKIEALADAVRNCLDQFNNLKADARALKNAKPPNSASNRAKAKYEANLKALLLKIDKINGKIAKKTADIRKAEAELQNASARDRRSTSAKSKSHRKISKMKKNLSKAKGTGLSLQRDTRRAIKQAPPRAQ